MSKFIIWIWNYKIFIFDTTKGFTENFSCQIWNIILVIKNRPFLLLKLSNFTRIFGYFQWKRSARGYLVISQKRARFFSVNFIYIGGVYIYIYMYIHCTALHCIYTVTSRNNPIRPIFKLPKGGRKLVECLPIIIKKIGKFGIAEFYISPATCQKFDINDWWFVETIGLNSVW